MRRPIPREIENASVLYANSCTHAYANYSTSIRQLDALMAMVLPVLKDETELSKRYLNARRYKIENDYAGPSAIYVNETMLTWQVAMRVSAFEVYLQDVLTFLALFDEEFIRSRNSKQEWDYSTVRDGSDTDTALFTFCNRWAKGFVSNGGPKRWGPSLEKCGIGTFSIDDVAALESMWGLRHITVHNETRITPEFTKRHPDLAKELDTGKITTVHLENWTTICGNIIDSIEFSIVTRLRKNIGEDVIEKQNERNLDRVMEMMDEWNRAKETEPYEDRESRISSYEATRDEQFAIIDELFR